MPSFLSILKGRDGPRSKSRKNSNLSQLTDQIPAKPKWEDAWTRGTVEPEEVQDLIRRCTKEIKDRALDLPFLLLPFRPTSDPSAVRTFVRHFFDGGHELRGEALTQELRMTEPMVITGVIKWCWGRLQGGVVGWDSYELFKVGEQDSHMARDSFKTFIPLSVDSGAKSSIIFDFFDLLSAVAAHGKVNGFGGRKLSRMAAWWAFEHKDTGNGFDSGYKTWLAAADATCHLFFAYLRSLAPNPTVGGISLLPRSLEKLLAETEYPPQRPSLMQSSTNRVVMIVDSVSPTPFALLRRARHFQYRDEDRALREWSEYEDPVQALTEECRRVLRSISAANQSQAVSSSKHSTSLRDASWSRFEDIGFASALEEEDEDDEARPAPARRQPGLRTVPVSGNGLGRPTTPSWADFLSSGFVDDGPNKPSNMLLPPDQVLPPIDSQIRQRSSQSHKPRLENDRHLEPGELASITRFDLDDAFWWVWISSLAPEETPDRKSAFGRCAVVETLIRTGRWLVMEEMVKGAAPEPDPTAYIAEKKGFFSWTRRNKGVSRRKSTGRHALDKRDGNLQPPSNTLGLSKTSIGGDQHARIQAAALQLQAKQAQEKQASQKTDRRGRTDADVMAEKTNSVLTMQPQIMSEASPALKWASKYDKETIREAYLANTAAGRGVSTTTLPLPINGHTNGQSNGSAVALNGYDRPPEVPTKSPSLLPQPSPAVVPLPQSPFPTQQQEDESPLETPRLTEKQVEAPRDLHPAERPSDAAGRSTPIPPPQEPESLELAREAMISPEPDLSPESKKRQKKLHKELQKDKTGNGGFRKLFGRKNRTSKVPENAADQLSSMGVKDVEPVAAPPTAELAGPEYEHEPAPTKPSFAREETTYATPPERADPIPEQVTPSFAPPVSAPVPEPVYAPSEKETVSRVNTADAHEANTEFSRFDQGPLVDQPAFIPNESEEEDDDAAPPPIARKPSRSPVAAPRQAPQPPVQRAAEPETTQSTVQPAAVVQDRWAQIRKNAAERAAQRQGAADRPPAPPGKPADADEDTSGEETIESRVARIKARVAELTGNMEGHGGPGNATPPPIRR
ncbi:DUF1708-domain-containing protein [Coniochaeta ligniaria NRRL 30616]|uniref:DUF1708-domain-containing protein n=1 Tax=Coniochaeta ligniaria NRRL 30616 TaxID=1408157 RepID=A0A1J7IFD8_9PEZI|nr:DUF1708-domain-containing protein [Coniochaeta ligniaria NRRL 30616]